MTTRRRIICSILSALVFLAACSLLGPIRRSGSCASKCSPTFLSERETRAGTRSARLDRSGVGLLRARVRHSPADPKRFRLARKRAHPVHADLAAQAAKRVSRSHRTDELRLDRRFSPPKTSAVIFVAGRPRVDRIGNCSQGLGSYIIAADRQSVSLPGPTAEPDVRRHRTGPRARPCLRRRTCRRLSTRSCTKTSATEPNSTPRTAPSSKKTAPARLPNKSHGGSPVRQEPAIDWHLEHLNATAEQFQSFKSCQMFQKLYPMLNNIRIIMVRPRGSGNIGSVARAMKNIGANDLAIVGNARTQSFWAKAMAVHGRDILGRSQVLRNHPRSHRRLHAGRRHDLPRGTLSQPQPNAARSRADIVAAAQERQSRAALRTRRSRPQQQRSGTLPVAGHYSDPSRIISRSTSLRPR